MRISKGIVITLIIVVAVVFVAFGVFVGIHVSANNTSSTALSPYSAVYLSTGDVYFGVLDWSPSPHMENAWFLQRSTDASGNATVGVYPFTKVAWGPSDAVYFNSKQIIFWTRLSSTSSVAQLMENPSVDSFNDLSSSTPSSAPAISQ